MPIHNYVYTLLEFIEAFDFEGYPCGQRVRDVIDVSDGAMMTRPPTKLPRDILTRRICPPNISYAMMF